MSYEELHIKCLQRQCDLIEKQNAHLELIAKELNHLNKQIGNNIGGAVPKVDAKHMPPIRASLAAILHALTK